MSQRIKDTKQLVSIDRFGKVVRKTEETPTSFKKLAFIRSGNTEGGISNTNTEGKIIKNHLLKKNVGDILASWDNVEFSRNTSASFWPLDYGIDDKTLYWYPPDVIRSASLSGGEKGVLHEKISTNNIPESEDFSTWTLNLGATIDANVSGSPAPENITATRLNFSSSTVSGISITSSVIPDNFTSASLTVFVKGEANQAKSTFSIRFRRKNTSFVIVGPFTASYDEWNRFEVKADLRNGTTVPEMWIINGSIADSHSVLIYGAQMEFGTTSSVHRSSYIHTSGTEVSRGNEVIYLDNSWDLSLNYSMNIIPGFSSSENTSTTSDYFFRKLSPNFGVYLNGEIINLRSATNNPYLSASVQFDGRKEYRMIFEPGNGIWSANFEQGLYSFSSSFVDTTSSIVYIGSFSGITTNSTNVIIGEPKFYKSPFDE